MTKIEWTNKSWNPITGCDKISPGCKNCYAERMSHRLAGRAGYPPAPNNFKVTPHLDRLNEPDKWRKPQMIFVCSMGDLFHEDVPIEMICNVFRAARNLEQHTFQILTKRPERMYKFLTEKCGTGKFQYPFAGLPNIWLGVTCENQKCADERIPWLLKTPAAVRFVSAEPLLEPIRIAPEWFSEFDLGSDGIRIVKNHIIHWIIVGAETGPGKRPMQNEWAESIRTQCREAQIPFFFKKDDHGNGTLNRIEYHEYPDTRRIK